MAAAAAAEAGRVCVGILCMKGEEVCAREGDEGEIERGRGRGYGGQERKIEGRGRKKETVRGEEVGDREGK